MTPPNTPMLVGIGTVLQREQDPARAQDPLALMLRATHLAAADAGAPALLPALGRILVPRGRWTYANPAGAIAHQLGATRAATVLSTVGVLQQTLFGQACNAIAAGEIDTALVVGADTGHRILRARLAGAELHTPDPGGTPDQLLAPEEDLRHPAERRAGLHMPVGLYAMMEAALRARQGLSVDAHRDRIAALYARFSAIATANPHAWDRTPHTLQDIRDPSARNPMQAFPYTKLHCSSWNVDQAAALLFCSARTADAVGIPHHRRIYPWSSTESNHMLAVSARAQLDACPGAAIAARAALDPFNLGAADLDLVDLYSCFPVAVQTYAAALGLDPGRDFTVTGGMSFAGGPYNNYVLQSTARMAQMLREGRGQMGLVSSVSGTLTKQGFGLWSPTPAPGGFHFNDVTETVARAAPARDVDMDPHGPARIAGFTVLHDRNHPPKGVAILDLEQGRRAVATTANPALIAQMQQTELCGAAAEVTGETFHLAA